MVSFLCICFLPQQITYYWPRRVVGAVDGGVLSPVGLVAIVPAAAAAALLLAEAPALATLALAIVAGAAAGGGVGIDGADGVEKHMV